ncbi:MAG: T9SS type A sorting domain-containing protein [Bacteroidetes bacterium]|nr:T9SS type A sorting domain-containing protein [Bacteroidota bacterium]
MLLNLEQSGKTVFEMDSVQEQLVRQTATMPVSSLARTNARAILFIVFHEQFSDEFQLNSSLRMMQMNPETNEYQFTPEHKYLGENYPNPFNHTTVIPYILSEGSAGVIRIHDINGKLMGSFALVEGINQLQLNTNDWESGVYTYSMEIDGMEMEHRKMVLIKE